MVVLGGGFLLGRVFVFAPSGLIGATVERVHRCIAGVVYFCLRYVGADLIGYFAPHEGSATTAYGVYSLPSLADYEAYKQRLAADPIGLENYEFAKRERFIRKEDRIFLKLASAPHAELILP